VCRGLPPSSPLASRGAIFGGGWRPVPRGSRDLLGVEDGYGIWFSLFRCPLVSCRVGQRVWPLVPVRLSFLSKFLLLIPARAYQRPAVARRSRHPVGVAEGDALVGLARRVVVLRFNSRSSRDRVRAALVEADEAETAKGGAVVPSSAEESCILRAGGLVMGGASRSPPGVRWPGRVLSFASVIVDVGTACPVGTVPLPRR
jgi:hypothetical protein